MLLFESFERTLTEYKREAEPSFDFLNRSARPGMKTIRTELQSWFDEYPDQAKLGLVRRFRSKEDSHHLGAFFELFLHRLLVKLDCAISVDPTLRGVVGHPDFHVAAPDGSEFYLEGTVVTGVSKREASADLRFDQVLDALDAIESPDFWLDIRRKSLPAVNVPLKKMAREVGTWLDSLRYDEELTEFDGRNWANLPTYTFRHEEWSIELRAIPKGPNKRGQQGVRTVGIRGVSAGFVDVKSRIRDRLARKAGKYGTPDLPYVVAVNVLDQFADRDDLVEALFGSELIPIIVRNGEFEAGELARAGDGFWRNWGGARNTRVSAVLAARPVLPWHIAKADINLFHNPWASDPYTSVLCRLPQVIPLPPYLDWREGISLGEIFQLDVGWPTLHS